MNERTIAQQQNTVTPTFTPLPVGMLQRKCTYGQHTIASGECAECRKKRLSLQRRAGNQAQLSTVPPIVREVLRSPGQPLDSDTHAFMESRFGYDFSQVRVHTDAKAAESARTVHARAYTVGRDIVFGAAEYCPNHQAGAYLLAHELTHVLQTRWNGWSSGLQTRLDDHGHESTHILGSPANSPAERQANRTARAVVSGLSVSETPVPTGGIQLTPDTGATGEATSALPAVRVRRRLGVTISLTELLLEWHNAGLLDPPFRPPDVPEIPPMPVSEEQASALGLEPAATGLAAPALLPRPTGPVRPPLRVITGGGAAAGGGRAAATALGATRFLTAVGAFFTVLLWPSETAPAWMDTVSRITWEPYNSPEEYEWERRLTDPQLEYLRWLNQVRRARHRAEAEIIPFPGVDPRTTAANFVRMYRALESEGVKEELRRQTAPSGDGNFERCFGLFVTCLIQKGFEPRWIGLSAEEMPAEMALKLSECIDDFLDCMRHGPPRPQPVR